MTYTFIWICLENRMFPRHYSGVKPSIIAGWKELSIPRLGASSNADCVGGASEDEVSNRMWIFEVDNAEVNGDCANGGIVSVLKLII
jgi:hypothetical protein